MVELDILDIPERQLQVIERLRITSSPSRLDGPPPIEVVWNADPASLASKFRQYDLTLDGSALGTVPIAFKGLVPTLAEGRPLDLMDAPDELKRAVRNMLSGRFGEVAGLLCMLHYGIHWLHSLRAIPRRVARFGTAPNHFSPDGANASAYLAHDVCQLLAKGALAQEVSAAFEKITGHRLEVRRHEIAGEEQFSVVIAPTGASAVEIPLADTGGGMAQLLPVIVLGCLARLRRLSLHPIMIVEHPELHLHPVAHAPLAEFFCDLAALEPAPTAVVETHSENFLLRVQIAIAKGELSADKVVVHYIRALDGGSVVDTITFDDAARPLGAGWPPGVFSEDLVQARELLAIRKARGYA